MNLLRVTARVLTGSTYVLLGLDAARTPGARVEMAASTLAAIRRFAPLPQDDERIVRGNAAVQAVAGATLTIGVLPRLSALALAGSLIPTTWAGHPFWRIDDPVARKQQRVQFHKNLALVGGLIFAVLDSPRP
jgi:putative oxidoreductase